jgi:hypothetical protein
MACGAGAPVPADQPRPDQRLHRGRNWHRLIEPNPFDRLWCHLDQRLGVLGHVPSDAAFAVGWALSPASVQPDGAWREGHLSPRSVRT